MESLVLLLAMVLTQALPTAAEPSWGTVLTGFDLIRSEAFQQGRADLLQRVYAPGSPLLGEDRRMIDSYADRDIHIDDLRMEIVSADLVERGSRRVRLDVVDRLLLTRVLLPDGSVRDLPQDQPTRHTIELRLTADGWRISSVRP